MLVSGQSSAAIACNHVIPCPWDSAQHISHHSLSLGDHYGPIACWSFAIISPPSTPLGTVSMLCSSPLIISVTGVLVVGCAGLPWLPPWTLGSAWRFPHQAPSPQAHLADEVNWVLGCGLCRFHTKVKVSNFCWFVTLFSKYFMVWSACILCIPCDGSPRGNGVVFELGSAELSLLSVCFECIYTLFIIPLL